MCTQQGEGSSSWAHGAGDARSGGRPNTVDMEQPLPDMVRRGLGGDAPSAFFISTPSTITSESSSDLDTESAGSFFPEKSTTLGSLIGLQSTSSQSDKSQALVRAQGMMECGERRKSTGVSGSSSNSRSRTTWCPMFGCGKGSSREAFGMSPSLAHLLEEERKAAGSQRQANINNRDEGEQCMEHDREGSATPSMLAHRNTLFDEEGILPPHPSGAPSLQHTSPTSSYLSVDWNVLNGRHPHHHHRGGGGGGEGSSHAKLSAFWPNICGRLLGTRLTT